MKGLPLVVACLAFAPLFAVGQAFPLKPVRLLVPSTPGGSVDTVARTVGGRLSERWGQQLVIDNRTGAGGGIAASIVAKSPPDGYTLILGTVAAFAINVGMKKSLPYDPARDFSPITLMATQDLMLIVHPSIPARSVKELVALAKRQPGHYSYASAGNGTGGHLSGELFKSLAGIELLHVPYKGVAPLLVDLAAGEVSMTFASLLAGSAYVSSGKVRALAVTGARRSPSAPELPTMAEAGVPGYESSTWYGILAPARTPAAIIARLNQDVLTVLREPDVHDRLAKQGVFTVGTTPDAFRAHITREIRKWGEVMKAAGIVPQ